MERQELFVTTIAELRNEIRSESKAAGFRSVQAVSSEAIRRRRLQISLVASVVFFGVVLATLRASVGTEEHSWIDADLVKAVMITVAGVFTAYVVEKELHLRRLDQLGSQERDLHLDAANRIIEHAAFAEVEGEVFGSLILEDVLDAILDGALELTGSEAGRFYLLREDATATVWTERGESIDDTRLATRVAAAGKPMLVSRSGVPAVANGVRMAAPVRVNETLIGVIELEPTPGWVFDAVDVELLDRFCVRSGRALAHSCRYEDALFLSRPSDN